jgi:excinuclease ABC subunit C
MLQRMRDEAHRFAITYNRKRRSMRTVTSELLKIKGVGPEKRRALLNAFGSVQGVREAGAQAIAQLPGFSAASAERLLAALVPQSGAPTNPEDSLAERTESAVPAEGTSDVTNEPSVTNEMPSASEIVEQG